MSHQIIDSDANPCEGILVIVNEIWKSLDDFIEDLPEDVNYHHFELLKKNALNRIQNYFN